MFDVSEAFIVKHEHDEISEEEIKLLDVLYRTYKRYSGWAATALNDLEEELPKGNFHSALVKKLTAYSKNVSPQPKIVVVALRNGPTLPGAKLNPGRVRAGGQGPQHKR
ncbi:MAG: hypothetical protein P4M11_02675 [Candidatus Pacebacteria bacterium]|nr:hypothetical protein [Candidatus Paceibacterota bacterium]